MNRNELIGTCIGKILGYAVQGVVYAETAKVISPRNVVLLKTAIVTR